MMDTNNAMFCYQCQETMGGTGCTRVGMCGKKPDLAAMQDLLIYVTKGLSAIATQLRREKTEVTADVNHMVTSNLFATITNADFDKEDIISRIEVTLRKEDELLAKVSKKDALPEASLWRGSREEFAAKAAGVGVLATKDEDIRSFRELITYGVKGLAAYVSHANALGKEDTDIDMFIQTALAQTMDGSVQAMAAAFELLPESVYTPVLRATVYEGLYAVGAAVLNGTFRKRQRRKDIGKADTDYA